MRLLRAIFCLALCLWPSAATAEPIGELQATICSLANAGDLSARDVLAQRDQLDCSPNQFNRAASHIWIVADIHGSTSAIDDPKVILRLSRQASVTLHEFRTDRSESRTLFDSDALAEHWHAMDATALPLQVGAADVETLVIGVDHPWDPANWGPMELVDGRKATSQHVSNTILAGLLCGLLFAPVLLNLVLIFALRHRFILFHSVMVGCIFIYALSWSGLIYQLLPWLNMLDRSTLNHLIIPVAFLAACFLTHDLCEPGTLPRSARNYLIGSGALPLAAGVGLMAAWPAFSHFGSVFFHALFIVPLTTIIITLVIARRRGSDMALVQLFGWSGIFVYASGRILEGLGWIEETPFTQLGFFPVMVFEALVTSLIVAYRMYVIRSDLDKALSEREALLHSAETDFLTGIPNRRFMVEHFSDLILQAERREGVSALLIIDIDHFKRLNDQHGHNVGDVVLTQFAQLLQREQRRGDICARIGGEEFAMVINAPSLQGAITCAQRLCDRTAAFSFGPDEHPVGPVTVSVGVVSVNNVEGVSFQSAYTQADEALYRAKNMGRNRVEVAGEDQAPALDPMFESMAFPSLAPAK